MENEIKRTPIIVERTPIIADGILKWDDVYDKLVNYIKYASGNVAFQYQTGANAYDADDLFQIGLELLWKCYNKYNNRNLEEFSAIFKSSLWRKLRETGRRHRFECVDIENAWDLGYDDEMCNDLYEEYKLTHLAEMLEEYPIALTILKEFQNPSTRTLWEAEMDVARKQMLKKQGLRGNAPTQVTIKGVHIMKSLDITSRVYNENLKILQNKFKEVYDEEIISDDEEIKICS